MKKPAVFISPLHHRGDRELVRQHVAVFLDIVLHILNKRRDKRVQAILLADVTSCLAAPQKQTMCRYRDFYVHRALVFEGAPVTAQSCASQPSRVFLVKNFDSAQRGKRDLMMLLRNSTE